MKYIISKYKIFRNKNNINSVTEGDLRKIQNENNVKYRIQIILAYKNKEEGQ